MIPSMEWKKLLYGCVGLFAACALAGCGKEEEENLQYLNLSDIACTFTGEDNLPFTVTVYAYADWTAESDASWAKVGDKTAESFTITVDDNPDSAERSARISLTAGALSREITVFQMDACVSVGWTIFRTSVRCRPTDVTSEDTPPKYLPATPGIIHP